VTRVRRVLVVACAALAREIKAIQRLGGWDHVEVRYLPAELHNRPDRIPEAVRVKLDAAAARYDQVFVAYADCGTGGRLDALLAEHRVQRLPGAHCYEFFAGADRFAALHEAEPGSFYLTDFLVRHFDRLVIRGLGLDRHPELLPSYFGNYVRVVHLAQSGSRTLEKEARAAAQHLGLGFESRYTGLGPFERALSVVQPSGPVPC
jgi:hypothetical protein